MYSTWINVTLHLWQSVVAPSIQLLSVCFLCRSEWFCCFGAACVEPFLESKLWYMFVLECVRACVCVCSMCISAWVCVFHVGHPMGTKRAVCAPSGAEMYTLDNRRLQSFSIGAALLIVPHAQWAFLSLSVFFSLSFSLYDHIQTVFLMRVWKNVLMSLLFCVPLNYTSQTAKAVE